MPVLRRRASLTLGAAQDEREYLGCCACRSFDDAPRCRSALPRTNGVHWASAHAKGPRARISIAPRFSAPAVFGTVSPVLGVDPMDVFCVGLMIAVFAGIVGGFVYIKKSAKRFAPDGALADAFADADQRFSLDMPEGGPVDLYVHYSLRATSRSGGGISYGMIMRLDVERQPSAAGYRDAQPFVLSHEYLFGQAHRGFGEVPIGECVDAGPSMRAGLEITRGVLVAHLPAGGHLRVRGRIAPSGATEIQSFLLFTKPPRGK